MEEHVADLEPGTFRCAMCGGIFPEGDEDEALAEALSRGFDPRAEECVLLCDDCNRATPWGRLDGRN